MTPIVIDTRNSRWRRDLRCNSPYCTHRGSVVQLFGLVTDKFWCTECGMVSGKKEDFLPRTAPLSGMVTA